MMREPKAGDIVNFVLDDGRNEGEIRPAIIVHVWDVDNGCSQLQVFTDGDGGSYNDGLPNVIWKTSILHNSNKETSTWHYRDE